jgi:hypothetical protein
LFNLFIPQNYLNYIPGSAPESRSVIREQRHDRSSRNIASAVSHSEKAIDEKERRAVRPSPIEMPSGAIITVERKSDVMREIHRTPLKVCLISYRSNPYCGGQGVYVRNLNTESSGISGITWRSFPGRLCRSWTTASASPACPGWTSNWMLSKPYRSTPGRTYSDLRQKGDAGPHHRFGYCAAGPALAPQPACSLLVAEMPSGPETK